MSDRSMWLHAKRVSLFFMLADALGAGAYAQEVNPNMAQRVEYQFRDGITKHSMLTLYGHKADTIALVQPAGLRLNFPEGRTNPGEVGIESRQRLRGDFEITLDYELLLMPDPGPDLGAGAALQVTLETPDELKARMSRTRKGAASRFGVTNVTRKPDGKEGFRGLAGLNADATITKGQFRMVRIGGDLTYQVNEGDTGFRTIATTEVGVADVVSVKACGATGWKSVAMDLLFPRLEVRSSTMPADGAGPNPHVQQIAVPVQPPEAPVQPTFGVRPALLLVIGIGLALSLAMFVGLVVFLRKRRTDVPTSAKIKGANK